MISDCESDCVLSHREVSRWPLKLERVRVSWRFGRRELTRWKLARTTSIDRVGTRTGEKDRGGIDAAPGIDPWVSAFAASALLYPPPATLPIVAARERGRKHHSGTRQPRAVAGRVRQ